MVVGDLDLCVRATPTTIAAFMSGDALERVGRRRFVATAGLKGASATQDVRHRGQKSRDGELQHLAEHQDRRERHRLTPSCRAISAHSGVVAAGSLPEPQTNRSWYLGEETARTALAAGRSAVHRGGWSSEHRRPGRARGGVRRARGSQKRFASTCTTRLTAP